MMHPATELRFISPEKGFGVFAKAYIPAGTIVYVLDSLDIVIAPDDPRLSDPLYMAMLERYCYNDEHGNHILCWDHGRYMNHCCQPNTLTTGYGFEIALTDIAPGDELTDDYGLLNIGHSMSLMCDRAGCRGVANPDDLDRITESCDVRIREAMKQLRKVPQALWTLLPSDIEQELNHYLNTGATYRSVAALRPLGA